MKLLDDPVWSALTSVHANFSLGTGDAKRYHPDIAPFVAFKDAQQIEPLIKAGESFFMVGDLPALPAGWTIKLEIHCSQMVAKHPLPAISSENVSLLTAEDATEMYDLINSVQPGLYRMDTRLMGTYYGIKQDGKLVAMAGERIRMTGFTELSAVCTNPAYTGRGYAQQLVAHLCRQHAAAGIVSYLHVDLSNHRAIRLYEHLGFESRRPISFWLINKGATSNP